MKKMELLKEVEQHTEVKEEEVRQKRAMEVDRDDGLELERSTERVVTFKNISNEQKWMGS